VSMGEKNRGQTELPRFRYYQGRNPGWPEQILRAEYAAALKSYRHMVDDDRTHLDIIQSNQVPMHVVLTKETGHMIGADQLAMMKPSAVLINTSRGPVVDEHALVEAIDSGRIAAAGLDVFEEEPLPSGSKLRELGDKVLLSPHMVSSNSGTGGLRPGVEWATRSVLSALRGEVPDNVYNKEVIPA
ncbi:MAG: NAD(P)-dependent oxidoreductase, partial [Pseudomonadota bacterium]|nr:NAD(P)-dependent oxidoreductase [Pseudomonadota bacterium]